MHIRSFFVLLLVSKVMAYTVLGSTSSTGSSSTRSGGGGVPGMTTTAAAAAEASQLPETPVLPKTYRALVAREVGDSFADVATIIDVETPTVATTLKDDEVLIRVVYAGINGGCETFRARAEHAFVGNKDLKNFRLGAEGVGIVASIGSGVAASGDFSVGDTVCFVGSAFAEYTTSRAGMLWKIPEGCSSSSPNNAKECVGLRISALTACAMLEETGEIRAGETVLITAAAGGAGHFAVQFAKLAGCEVIGTCGSPEKEAVLRELGCDHVINYKTTRDVGEELRRIAPSGLDVVLEGVGGSMLKTALDCLGPEGRLLQIGYISEYPHSRSDGDGDDSSSSNNNNNNNNNNSSNNNNESGYEYDDFNVADLFWKSQTIRRGGQTIYGNAWPKDFSRVARAKERVLELFANQQLKSIVDESSGEEFVGLESVTDAVSHMLSGKTIGKVVVRIS